jgi:hypothetical protein
MGFSELSTILWRERQLLELLLFKLEEEQLLLTAGRTRWLTHAAREVETVLDDIRAAELVRSGEVEALAPELGLATGPPLSDLIDASPSPWNQIMSEHREAFLALSQEILTLAETNRELITRGQRAVQEALGWLSGPGGAEGTYSRTGETENRRGEGARLFDKVV